MSKREEFLAGERPEDVFMYISAAAVDDLDTLADHGERVGDGVVIVVEGETGRSAFQSAVGVDPMTLAQQAMGTHGSVDPDCTGGDCPAADDHPEESHDASFIFSFVEEQIPEEDDVSEEGLYSQGDVVHAYVSCQCGQVYSDKWVAGERDGE